MPIEGKPEIAPNTPLSTSLTSLDTTVTFMIISTKAQTAIKTRLQKLQHCILYLYNIYNVTYICYVYVTLCYI